MITNQILKTLLDNAALSEKDGLTFKEIQQCLTEDFSVKVLQSMRVDGLINNAMQKNLNVWWLTAKGADMALVDVETMQPISEPEPQCPASVGGDIDPDMTDSMLEEPVVPPAPDYDPKDVAFNQHTDAFNIAQSNQITIGKISSIVYAVADHNNDIIEDGIKNSDDAVQLAHDMAAKEGKPFMVEQKVTYQIGSAIPVSTTQWVAA